MKKVRQNQNISENKHLAIPKITKSMHDFANIICCNVYKVKRKPMIRLLTNLYVSWSGWEGPSCCRKILDIYHTGTASDLRVAACVPWIHYHLVESCRRYCTWAEINSTCHGKITVKILTIQTSERIAVITLKFEQGTVMHPKDAEGIANSVDPDQTASRSALFAQTCLSENLGS